MTVAEDGAGTYDADAFRRDTGVSRETLERLEAYAALAARWRRRMNLASSRSLADVWRRHMLDSAQLADLAPAGARVWVDAGSGAGFPGLVLAILGRGRMFLVEKDARKCAFLREAVRLTEAEAEVVESRVEALGAARPEERPFPPPRVVTARALAPLDRLLAMVAPLCGPETVCLFPKGQDVGAELTKITRYANIDVDRLPSRTAAGAAVLRIEGLGTGGLADNGR